LICGELSPPDSIAVLSDAQGFLLHQINKEFSYDVSAHGDLWDWRGLDVDGNALKYTQMSVPSLPVQNAATALQVISLLGLKCNLNAINAGLVNAGAIGRLQSAQYKSVSLLLDVAHNPQSATYLAETLAAKGLTGKVRLILGVLGDKDSEGVIKALAPVVSDWHFVSLDVYRGQTAQQLGTKLSSYTENSQSYYHDDMASALEKVNQECRDDQQVVVAGSFVTVSQVLELL